MGQSCTLNALLRLNAPKMTTFILRARSPQYIAAATKLVFCICLPSSLWRKNIKVFPDSFTNTFPLKIIVRHADAASRLNDCREHPNACSRFICHAHGDPLQDRRCLTAKRRYIVMLEPHTNVHHPQSLAVYNTPSFLFIGEWH